jgi:hypothetical protein
MGVLERLKRRIKVKAGAAAALLLVSLMLSGESGMVYVPAGIYEVSKRSTPKRIHIDAPFWIDRYEVSQADYRAFDSSHQVPRGEDTHPATRLDVEQARKYANALGHRLPTDAEWEVAARGPRCHVYPWGDEPAKGAANLKESAEGVSRPVGTYSRDCSGFGVQDMAGNVREYTHDGVRHNIVGGSFRTDLDNDVLSPPSHVYAPTDEIGFRTVKEHGVLARLLHAIKLLLLLALCAAVFWLL